MTDADLFMFLSSYRGEHDHRRRADGRRYRYTEDDPTRTLQATDGLPVPEDAAAEWRRYRIAQCAEFVGWCAERDFLDKYAATIADGWPELVSPD